MKLPIIMIEKAYVAVNKDCLNFLFGKAYELKPSIIYIFEEEENVKISESLDVKESFILDLQLIKNIDKDIIILGSAKNNNFESQKDIATIGFNLEKKNPSYQERLEFLEFLLRQLNLSAENIGLDYFAKKTLGFSYDNLCKLITNIEKSQKNHIIDQLIFDKNLKIIIENYKIYQILSDEDLYHTCVHEAGHAIMTFLLKNNFTLHSATITPHYYDSNQYLGKTQFTKYSYKLSFNKQIIEKNKIINYQHIKISFAGKIAEQIIFGLPNQLPLTPTLAFENFIKNPEGAVHDLCDAIDLLNKHNEIISIKPVKSIYYYNSYLSQSSPFYKDFCNIYKETFEILLPLKDKIIEVANLLKEKESLMRSEINTIMQN